MRLLLFLFLCLTIAIPLNQTRPPASQAESLTVFLLKPGKVFDGEQAQLHDGWAILVRGQKIETVGPLTSINVPADAKVIDLPGLTLMPGLIEAHSHILLHPYSETVWNDQVARESLSLRVARATNHLRNTLQAGFTTVRDLGTEGAGYADVGLKQAIEQGIIPGPRMLVATRALVATGAYEPKGFEANVVIPQGAEEADGGDLVRAGRQQVGAGADVVRLYADYHWRPGEPSRPTFSEAEMQAAVEAAHSAGRTVAAHANTAEGMRRAVAAGVDTIEHGGEGTADIFKQMKAHGVA